MIVIMALFYIEIFLETAPICTTLLAIEAVGQKKRDILHTPHSVVIELK